MILLGVSACGGSHGPRAETESAQTGESTAGSETGVDECEILRNEADALAAERTRCREDQPIWTHQAAFDELDGTVGRRLATVRSGLHPPTHPHEAQAIADRIWTLLDAIAAENSGGLENPTIRTVEETTENLIRQTSSEERTEALAPLASALGALRASLEPTPDNAECRDEERAAATALLRADAACVVIE